MEARATGRDSTATTISTNSYRRGTMDANDDASTSTSTPLMRVDVVGSGYESDGELEEDAMGDGRDDGRDDDDDDDGNEDDFDDFDDETRPFAARTRSTYVGVLRRASTSMSARAGELAFDRDRIVGFQRCRLDVVSKTRDVEVSVGEVGRGRIYRVVHRVRGVRDRCRDQRHVSRAAGGVRGGGERARGGRRRSRRSRARASARRSRRARGRRRYTVRPTRSAGVHYVMAVLNGIRAAAFESERRRRQSDRDGAFRRIGSHDRSRGSVGAHRRGSGDAIRARRVRYGGFVSERFGSF